MDRKKFLRNTIGAAVATVIGSKLGMVPASVVPPIEDLPLLPGIGGTQFKVKLTRNWIQAGDVFMSSDGWQYYAEKRGDSLIGVPVHSTDAPEIEIVLDDTDTSHNYRRLFSATKEVEDDE